MLLPTRTEQAIPREGVPLLGTGLDLSEETIAESDEMEEDETEDTDEHWELYEEDDF